MSLFKNIKVNYYNKLFDQLLIDKDISRLLQELSVLRQSNFEIYKLVAPRFVNPVLNNHDIQNPLKKNMILINTFFEPDIDIVLSFLKFYLPQTSNLKFEFCHFGQLTSNILEEIKFDKKIVSFEEFLDLNDYFQFAINSKFENNVFIINLNAFYEQTNKNRYFTYTSVCPAFFYLIRNPFHLYHEMTLIDDKEKSLNKILFSDKRNNFFKDSKFEIEENTQSWETNVKSWTNDNVMNTYNGHIIKYEEISNDSLQVFAEIIAHLNMVGIDIELDYDKINTFIENNIHHKIFTEPKDIELSNKVKKTFDAQFEGIARKFNYFA